MATALPAAKPSLSGGATIQPSLRLSAVKDKYQMQAADLPESSRPLPVWIKPGMPSIQPHHQYQPDQGPLPLFGRYWRHSGHWSALGVDASVAYDPSETSAAKFAVMQKRRRPRM
jgi:hypothetical protein